MLDVDAIERRLKEADQEWSDVVIALEYFREDPPLVGEVTPKEDMAALIARIRELEYNSAEMRKAYNALEREKFALEAEVEQLEERLQTLATLLARSEAGR